jgi:hypothetical protein
MKPSLKLRLSAVLAVAATVMISYARLRADDPPAKTLSDTISAARRVPPQPFSKTVEQGLEYLVSQQHASGGWGQGGGWRQNAQHSGRVEGENVNDPPDLGNTCIATLALVRAGNTPEKGKYAQNVAQAVAHICEYIERSDEDSLYATDVRDTQLQSKIGRYVDTFLAGLVLSELKGKMPADGSDKRVLAALEKTVRKIEKNQQDDGNFNGNTGWASVLSQAVCSKFINRAAQAQVAVNEKVLDRDYLGTVATLDRTTGKFTSAPAASAPLAGESAVSARIDVRSAVPALSARSAAAGAPSDAGVSLYLSASNASRISDLGNTTIVLEQRARLVLADKSASDEAKQKAESDLKRVDEVREAQKVAVRGLAEQLDDKGFIEGFGNNGGEEFLSYMNIGEMLVVQGGNEWEKWNKSISANLGRVQNQDGSWSGQHCITGRTFCTAAALLTLMADRAPVPLAANVISQPSNN